MPTLNLLDTEPLESALKAEVDRIWDKECALRPHLFDGEILEFVSLKDDLLTARRSSYRRYLAALAGLLNIRIVGVTALLQCQGRYLVARRSPAVMHAGLWEFAPSGALEGDDPVEQLLIELEEELHIPRENVALIKFLTAAEDHRLHSVDLCYRILLKKECGTLSEEYDALRWMSHAELSHFEEPTSELFLELKKFV